MAGAASSTPMSANPTPASSPGARSYTGYFEYPQNVSTRLDYDGLNGSISASATWAGDATLELSVDCPSISKSTSGPSGISVFLRTDDSTCTTELIDVTQSPGTISYVLVLSTPEH